jgi:hypothetical protein
VLNRYHVPFNVTVPAGTSQASPLIETLDTDDWWVYSIHVMIPSGHAGFTGLCIMDSGVGLVPFAQPPQYLIGNDLDWDFELGVEVAGALTFQAYNTDVFAHTFYCRVAQQPMGSVVAQPQTTIVPVS